MQGPFPLAPSSELADAIFQAVITGGLAILALSLYRQQRASWLAWWAAAWGLYLLRLLAIIAFLTSGKLIWLFAHQVATGWVALAILRAAMVFAGRSGWRTWYLALAAFPLLLAGIAVNSLDRFFLVAVPVVALISGATLWTGLLFWRHSREISSPAAKFVSIAFFFWGLHHLDYPFLRARGAWVPWGYFIDVAFELAVGVGFALMVLSETALRLASRTGELSRLQARSTEADERYRRKLARELHDETAQTLSAVKLEIGMLREGAAELSKDRLDQLIELMDDGIQSVRRAVSDLRPAQLDDLGLAPAIDSLARGVAERSKIRVTTDIANKLPRLDSQRELALFRAAQEAINNVIRHSHATEMDVCLTQSAKGLLLKVCDNGRGFSPALDGTELERDGHLGLVGMRERIQGLGGTVILDGSNGTTVVVELPMGSLQ